MEEALLQHSIDFGGSGAVVCQEGLGDSDMLLHAIEPLIFAIVEGVVDEGARLLRLADRGANNVHDGGAFGVGTSDRVHGGQFTDSEGSDEGSDA